MNHLFIFIQNLNIRTGSKYPNLNIKYPNPARSVEISEHKIPESDSKCRNIRTATHLNIYIKLLFFALTKVASKISKRQLN